MTATMPTPAATRDDLLELAKECCDYIRARNPYLRLVAVSGSLCRPDHEGVHEDIDFFVVARRGRLWRAFLGRLLNGWRFARSRGLDRTFFCFNYLVDEAHPEEIDVRRTEYAREFLNLCVLHGLDVYRDLLLRHEARLSQAEPGLYGVTLLRTEAMLAEAPSPRAQSESTGPEAPSPKAGRGLGEGFALHLAYAAAVVPFRLIARRMEARRRRLHPGGYVYSNDRVIRSHFRRGWHHPSPALSVQGEGVEEDGLPTAAAFDAAAPNYDEAVVPTPANAHMREQVWRELSKLLRPGMRVLDLGCGTGVDAVRLAQAGATVLAVDVSQGMVDVARRNIVDAAVSDRVEVRRLAIENLRSLLREHACGFDLVLCNFGALNLAGEPAAWAPIIARLLKPEGRLVASVMSRWCLPELVAGLLRLRPGFALRRPRGELIDVAGVPVTTALYTPGSFARALSAWFITGRARGLCLLVPPPTLERSLASMARSRFVRRLDAVLGRLPILRNLGDHFLIVMKRHLDGHVLFDAGAPITASPVVADVNGDGRPELIVAADRLHVLNKGGRALPGWPQRAGKPIASTPLVVPEGDGARIYAGSDDHALHAYDNTGRRLPGFPHWTGGDVFASPLALPGEKGHDIAFGSDDGCIYVVDAAGRARPGWPVRTGGYVSASVAAAYLSDNTRTEPRGLTRTKPRGSARGEALFAGSWDGHLYGLDASGRAVPGWPQHLGFPIWSTAAIADLDGDGYAEVIVAAHRLFALRGNGEALPGFPVRLGGYAVGSPAVADVDGDGRPEVVIASDSLYAFRNDGEPLPGFPLDLGAHVWASPILLDVDGDGRPEIVVTDMAGNVWAVSAQGRVLDGWPRQAGHRIAATPASADLDGDGYLELIVATWDGRIIVYHTDARADDYIASPWRTFPHRMTPEEPICLGETANRSPALPIHQEGVLEPGGAQVDAPNLLASVFLRPERPMPYRVTDIHLEVETTVPVEAGLLYYKLGGRLHPSPLLGRDGRYFAVVQPLPPLKRIDFYFELLTESGSTLRVPETGHYHMTVGRRGISVGRG